MATHFTAEQQKAIDTLDKSVLVSAAAGSGKTAVLVERIIRIILEGKADVDEMLVVTFTNAAAAEMRLRLAKSIRKRIADHPEDAGRMKVQLSKLYKAYISTIDSFALRVIKEFFHETDLEPSFAVCDDVQNELLKREAVAELLEDGFADDNLIEGCSFRGFLRLYSEERTDEGFMEGILKAYSQLRSMPDYFAWAYKKAEQLRITADSFEGSELQQTMTEDAVEAFANVTEAFERVKELFETAEITSMFESKLREQYDAVQAICDALCLGPLDTNIINMIGNIPTSRLVAKKDEKEAYEGIKPEVEVFRKSLKKEIDDFKNKYLVPDFTSRLAEMNSTYEYTVYYLRLLEEFERRYEDKKRERKVIDFADMEHYAVRILRNEEVAEILKKRFKFIFVDEYQDTNNIQEHLISRFARPDNVFRVGDVKQSIYRFRQAEPAIFERLYAEYKSTDKADGIAIDLGKNFRTNDRTINYVNRVFENVMEGYDDNARLYTGLECPDEFDLMPEVHILCGDLGNEDATSDSGEAQVENLPQGIDNEIEDITKEEAEAEYIADLVESIIGTEFYDTRIGKVRKAEARDIAILFRAVRYRGEIMSRALKERSIEPHIEVSEDYFDTVEIGVALALLKTIDNMRRDVPLIATLHSEVFGFDPEELAEIRIAHSGSVKDKQADSGYRRYTYWEAFEWYRDEGPKGALREKIQNAYAKLKEWRSLSRMMPLGEFVWKVIVDSGYYRMAGAMSGGATRQANLRSLADRAERFSIDNVSSLSSFISFVEVLIERKLNNGQTPAAGKDDDVVKITTIHKSKGLEYPFVIVGGLGHRFRLTGNEKGFSFDSEIGVGMPYIDPARKYWRSTMIQRAIAAKSRREEYREELRLLYVAMTRARNKLYMVGTVKSEEDLQRYTPRPDCFIKVMKDVVRTGENKYFISPLTLAKALDKKTGPSLPTIGEDMVLSESEQRLFDEIDRRLSYRYPDEQLLTSKAKRSVSEIRKEELKAEPQAAVTKLPSDRKAPPKVSSAEIGTAYHRIMEFLDFDLITDSEGSIDEVYIKSRAEELRESGSIVGEVFEKLELSRITAFFKSDIGRRALKAAADGTLMREKPFTLRTTRNGQAMLVQGVIDCCFEENESMILIDYKSGYVRQDKAHDSEIARIKKEYATQMELYSEAVAKGTGKEVSEAYLYLFAADEAILI